MPETFSLFNHFMVGGHIVKVREAQPFQTSYSTHCSVRPQIATAPSDGENSGGKHVFASVTMPKKFYGVNEQTFKEGGNVFLSGTMDTFTWEPKNDDGEAGELRFGINCGCWADSPNSKAEMPINNTRIVTPMDPVYANSLTAIGLPVDDPVTESQVLEVRDGVIVFLKNKVAVNKTGIEKATIIPVFLDEVPEGYGVEEDAVWMVEGPLGGKPLPTAEGADPDARPQYRDCVVSDTFVKVGEFDTILTCTQQPSMPF